MESIAVIKPDMTVAGQGSLSPFGLLSQLFTEELVRRGAQTIGSYRPLHLAYLEEDEEEAQQAPQEIHFDLNVELLVNRLLREERDEKKKQEKTPEQRILERVILREREIRTAHQETRRVVFETGGRRITASLPARSDARIFKPNTRETGQEPRQTGEERSTKNGSVPRRSAGLTRVFPAAAQHKAGMAAGERTLTLASMAASAPASGGWMPKEREAHPGYPTHAGQTANEGMGSILLPDVLRRRREQALERRESLPVPPAAFADETAGDAELAYRLAEDAIAWDAEGTEQTPESERVLYEVRRAVEETLHRNGRRREPVRETTDGRGSETERAVARAAAQTLETTQADIETAVPASEKAGKQTTAPAELIYRESEGETTDGRVSETARTAAQTAVPASEKATKQTTAPAELIYRESAGETAEGSAPETARAAAQTAVPASEKATKQTTAPTELIYRESAGETAEGSASETARAAAQTAVPASEKAAEQTTAPAELIYRESGGETTDGRVSETARTAAQTAVPASEKAAKQTTAPAELIYRESEGETAEGSAPETARAAAQTTVPASEKATNQTTAPAELIYRESEGETADGCVSETARTAARTAVPALEEASEQATAPAERIYRESGGETADGRASEAARTAAQTAVPASEEAAEQTTAPVELIYRESEGETADGCVSETARTAAQTAVPASEKATKQTTAPTELIYRESGGETADGRVSETARTAAQTAVPASEEAAKQTTAPAELIYRESEGETADGCVSETARTAVPARDELLGEQVFRPISMHLRTESEKPTARDIRMAKTRSAKTAVTSVRRTKQAIHTTAAQTAYQGIVDRDARLPAMGVPVPETAGMPAPAELVFAEPASASDTGAEQREEKTTARPTERAKQESAPERLPTWARELMEQAGVADAAGQNAAFFAMNGGAATQQINWTAPTALSAPSARTTAEPAQISFKERKEPEETPYRQPVSDAELRRTAEKVYKIIEERLRRELRRSGR